MHHSKLLYEKGILKNRKMLTQTQYSNFKFIGRLDHIKTFTNGMKSLTFGEIGHFHINEDGCRVTVENGKSLQASLFISASYFAEYYVDGIVSFSLNMNVISECLCIYSGFDCGMKMYYKGAGAPLIMVLHPRDEDDVATECSIKTTDSEQPLEFSLNEESPSLNVVFLRGHDFANIFLEIDKDAEEVKISLSPRHPHFKIETLGVVQSECCVEVAKTSDMIILFNCRDKTSACYRYSLIKHILKVLSVASKVALKTDNTGLLEMHFMLQSTDGEGEIYIQFYITPLVNGIE